MSEAWLTYAQAGERFGLSPDAIRMRARRLGWRIQPGNDGRARVLVPDDAAIEPRPRSAEGSPEQSGEIERLLDLLESADGRADRGEQRAEQAEQRADRAEKRVEEAVTDRRAAEARAERAEQALAGERSRADVLRDKLDALSAELGQAQDAAEEFRRAEEARQARGLLTRLKAAWRGK